MTYQNISKYLSSILFADDATFSFSNYCYQNLVQIANVELDKTKTWMYANKLSINVVKTFSMLFTNRQHDITDEQVILAGVNVPSRESGNFLGVMINKSLRFDMHESVLCMKLSKTAGIFNRLKNILPTDILIKLYYSLVYPYFLYCNSVWSSSSVLRHCDRPHILGHELLHNSSCVSPDLLLTSFPHTWDTVSVWFLVRPSDLRVAPLPGPPPPWPPQLCTPCDASLCLILTPPFRTSLDITRRMRRTLSAPVCWGLLFTSRCTSPTPPPRGACWAPKEFFLWVANGALAFSCCLVVGLFRQRLRE